MDCKNCGVDYNIGLHSGHRLVLCYTCSTETPKSDILDVPKRSRRGYKINFPFSGLGAPITIHGTDKQDVLKRAEDYRMPGYGTPYIVEDCR